MSERKLQVIPLGGLGEFGMNSMAFRYGDDIIVVDAGDLVGGELVDAELNAGTFEGQKRRNCETNPKGDPGHA